MLAAGKAGTNCREPLRSCLVCRVKLPKRMLLRHICEDTGAAVRIVEDAGQKMPGRGFYVCDREACREQFAKVCRRRCRKKRDDPAAAEHN